ncbi:Ig-like domain repeat protein [Ruminococcus sp.]|uniref:Ig-like domain repeat protein n=1 Tax=Ruminococcus sp. TaxID=41978 RepID=UPI0025EF4CAA|nr:Ig-like domain repeat protein [Ruminococcus sp.]MBQ6251442.1 Ig-like domain repeat protein [Ruminococcus sp.]
MRKKLLSIILVAMLSTNAIPYTAFAENGESGKTTAEEAAEPTSEAETPAVDASPVLKEVIDMSSKGNDIKVITEEYNGNYTAKLSKVEISELKGKDIEFHMEFRVDRDNDNGLVAKMISCDVTGSDAENYEFTNTDVETVCIIEKQTYKIDVHPVQTEMYLGESIPAEIECVPDDPDKAQDIHFYCKVKDASGKADVGTYEFEDPISKHGDYKAVFNNTYNFTVKSKELNRETEKKLPSHTEKLRGKKQRILQAPDGYVLAYSWLDLPSILKYKSLTFDLGDRYGVKQNKEYYVIEDNDHGHAAKKTYSYILYKNTELSAFWADAGKTSINDNGKLLTTKGDATIKVLLKREDDVKLNDIKLKLKRNGKEEVYDCQNLTENDVSLVPLLVPDAEDSEEPVTLSQTSSDGVIETKYEGMNYYYAEFRLPATGAGDADKYSNFELELTNDDDTKKETLTKALSASFGAEGTKTELLVDKKDPNIVSDSTDDAVNVTFDNQNNKINAQLNVSDGDSGIKKVEYKWDFEAGEDFDTNKSFKPADGTGSSEPNKKLQYKFSADLTPDQAQLSSFRLKIKVTDNAGNEHEYEPMTVQSKWDSESPEVYYAGFLDEEYRPAKMNMNGLGNFTNKNMKFVVIAKDVTAQKFISGINSAGLNSDKVKPKIYSLYNVGGVNEFIEAAKQKQQDKGIEGKTYLPEDVSWPVTKAIIDLIKEKKYDLQNEDIKRSPVIIVFEVKDIDAQALDALQLTIKDDGGLVYSSDVSDLVDGMEKNTVVYDADDPSSSIAYIGPDDKEKKYDTEKDYASGIDTKRVWLNENDKAVRFTVKDAKSGIKTIFLQKIDDSTGKIVAEGDIPVKGSIIQNQYSFAIPLLKDGDTVADPSAVTAPIDDGKYTYNLVITDNAGNVIGKRRDEAGDNKPVEYKVGVYKGKVNAYSQAIAGVSMPIADQIWVDDRDDISVKIKLDGVYAGVKDLKLTANGEEIDFNYNPSTGILTSDLKKKSSGVRVPYGESQRYRLVLTGEDNARHKITLSPQDETHPLVNDTIFVDCKKPEIVTVTAEDHASAGMDLLNFFTFGAFANDTVLLKAYINEPVNDSGINNVSIRFTNENNVKTMSEMTYVKDPEKEAEGVYVYTYVLPLADTAFYDEINIDVVDKCGKCNAETTFEISGNTANSKNCVVIEENAPEISIGFPKSDIISAESEAVAEKEEEVPENETELKENELVYPHHIGNYATDNLPVSDVWYAEHKHFSIKIEDAQSGINDIHMTLNGQPIDISKYVTIPADRHEKLTDKAETEAIWLGIDTEELHKELDEQPWDGHYELKIIAEDNSKNKSDEVVFRYNLDELSPQIEKFIFSPASADGVAESQDWLIDGDVPAYTYFFADKFWAVFRVSDAAPTSQLNRVDYRILPYENGSPVYENVQSGNLHIYSSTEGLAEDSEEYGILKKLLEEDERAAEENGEENSFVGVSGYAWLEIPVDFKGQIFADVFDNVGHNSSDMTTHGYVTDHTAPTVEITGLNNTRHSDELGNRLYPSETEVTVTIRDTQSGIRTVDYLLNSEKRTNEGEVLDLRDFDLSGTDEIKDGWEVTGRDRNLITEIKKTYKFDSDDNNIQITANAGDNSGNHSDSADSGLFTVDLTEPVIDVEINGGIDGTNYYSADHKPEIDIKITERNFDEDLINTSLSNTFGSTVPQVSFTKVSDTEHTAHLVFGEGDFSFDIRGTDRAGHNAKVNMDRSKFGRFYMDQTAPVVTNNFADFADDKTGNYLSSAKNIEITVVEHNFDPERTGLKVWQKDPGSEHDNAGFTDVTNSVISRADWKSDNDTHTLSAKLKKDGVYKIEVAPSDPSGNSAASSSSAVFELDTTKPEVTQKNGKRVDKSNADKFLDIYNTSRKDEAIPTVEFADANFDHLKYVLTVYAPQYKNGKELAVIRPQNMFLPEDKDETGTLASTKFALPEFDKDGVYALELIAVDKAGNESYLNSNTYMRLMDNDVLAYIPNSSQAKKTGWYSFQYENGDPISKRPDNFSDIEIVVFSEKNTDVNVVLRDYNGDEKLANLRSETDPSLYGVNISRFTMDSDYFKSNFGDDTDTELYLSVKNNDARIDLGRLHIDNIEPDCDLPKSLKSWKWFAGNKPRTITVSNINEQLDMSSCKVYDNGKEIDFDYSPENRSLSFKLEKGWHRVGVKLEDEAGNVYSIQEIDNLYIGYFWLWVILGSAAAIAGLAAFIISKIRKKKLY